MNYSYDDLLTMARTLWGEARGEPDSGKIAVAWVIRNRAEKSGKSIADVCLQPHQFSCWFDGQAPKVRTRTNAQLGVLLPIARGVLDGQILDNTQGANHYHTILRPAGVKRWPPAWAEGHRGTTIGSQIFYRI